MSELLFWFITVMTIGSALIVVLHSNIFYSALALVVTLFGVAAFYVFLWADFLAGVQVLIYIGGILILILFGIMLTNKISSRHSCGNCYGDILYIGLDDIEDSLAPYSTAGAIPDSREDWKVVDD